MNFIWNSSGTDGECYCKLCLQILKLYCARSGEQSPLNVPGHVWCIASDSVCSLHVYTILVRITTVVVSCEPKSGFQLKQQWERKLFAIVSKSPQCIIIIIIIIIRILLLARYVPNVAKRSIWEQCKMKYILRTDRPATGDRRPTSHLAHIGEISNGHISAADHPIYTAFGSRMGFSGSADRMALIQVWPISIGMGEKIYVLAKMSAPSPPKKMSTYAFVGIGALEKKSLKMLPENREQRIRIKSNKTYHRKLKMHLRRTNSLFHWTELTSCGAKAQQTPAPCCASRHRAVSRN